MRQRMKEFLENVHGPMERVTFARLRTEVLGCGSLDPTEKHMLLVGCDAAVTDCQEDDHDRIRQKILAALSEHAGLVGSASENLNDTSVNLDGAWTKSIGLGPIRITLVRNEPNRR